MNLLSFDLLNPGSLREDNWTRSFQLISWCKVIQQNAAFFLQYIQILDVLRRANDYMKTSAGQNVQNPDLLSSATFASVRELLEPFHEQLVSMKLVMSAKTSHQILGYLGQGDTRISIDRVNQLLAKLSERIIEELHGREFFMVKDDRSQFYRKEGTILGEAVVGAFRHIRQDAIEAGNCFAFARYSACVFHLMRIMEYIIKEFAEKAHVTVNPETDTWGTILDRIAQELSKWERGDRKKRFIACCKLMDGMRFWRNDLIHHTEHYSEERAQEVMGTVRRCVNDFMELPD